MADARSRLEDLIAQAERRLGHAVDDGNGRGDEGDQARHAHDASVSEHERARLADTIRQSRAALDRIEDGTYGICESCRREIPAPRLRVRPEASRCVPCEARREERRRSNGRSFGDEVE